MLPTNVEASLSIRKNWGMKQRSGKVNSTCGQPEVLPGLTYVLGHYLIKNSHANAALRIKVKVIIFFQWNRNNGSSLQLRRYYGKEKSYC
jgi:hypothetical protein